MRACPAGPPVKAHAPALANRFPTSGFGRRPERNIGGCFMSPKTLALSASLISVLFGLLAARVIFIWARGTKPASPTRTWVGYALAAATVLGVSKFLSALMSSEGLDTAIENSAGAFVWVIVLSIVSLFLRRSKGESPAPASGGNAYEIAGAELLEGRCEPGAWARALAEGGESEGATKAAYVRFRVAALQGKDAP